MSRWNEDGVISFVSIIFSGLDFRESEVLSCVFPVVVYWSFSPFSENV